ncbi:MAG: aminotransferase class IV [Desulfobacterales bacterium]|jgi:branched-chain amino acid aminotransferase|nr:aminotransferase class IV [Desulfobacterales bacterium]
MANVYYVDGKFVAEAEAVFPVNDLGLLRGYGCFDFMRTYHGKPIFIKDHVRRLFRSVREIGIELPWTETEICDLVQETLRRNPPVESNVRILVTGGPSADFITPQGKTRMAIMVAPVNQYPPAWYTDGAKIITVTHTRTIPAAKTIDYTRAIMVLAEARRKGAIEVVYMDSLGRVREGTTSNLFFFRGDTLVTPGENILHGITRQKVLELAEKRFQVDIRDILRAELSSADEAFITSSNRKIVPIVQVDKDTIGSGRPGARTLVLMQAFEELTNRLAAAAQ